MENQKSKVSNPFIISVKNLTDDKFYGIDILNISKHKEYDKKIDIRYLITGVTLQNFITQMQMKPFKTGLIRETAICDYKKFQDKQLRALLFYKQTDANGSCLQQPIHFNPDLYQQFDCILDSQNASDFNFNFGSTLILEYLMPESELIIHLFPIEEVATKIETASN